MTTNNSRPNTRNWVLIEKLIRNQRIFYNRYHLTRREFDVLECLCLHYNPEQGCAFPKQSTIADITGVDRSKVNQTLGKIEKMDLIMSFSTKGRAKKYDLTYLLLEELGLYNKERDIKGEGNGQNG